MSSLAVELEGDRVCRELAENHYENFSVVTRLVPRAYRRHMTRLYAYCRYVDDLGDEGPYATEERLARLDAWHEDLQRCWSGVPEHPLLQALQHTVHALALDREPFERLIEANRLDQRRDRYATFADLRDYCRRSADPVGEMVLALFGVRDPALVALSDLVCTGLQLANFCQDVAVDWQKGRVYLPLEDLERFGVPIDALSARAASPEFKALLAFEVARARQFLLEGAPLAQAVPASLRPPLGMFVRGGLAILERVEAEGYDVLSRRPTVSKGAKVMIALRTLVAQRTGRW